MSSLRISYPFPRSFNFTTTLLNPLTSRAPLLLLVTVLLASTSCTAWYYYRRATRVWERNLAFLGRPRTVKLKQTAVVCGGSISGIITARVCADHFEDVVLIDPEISKADKEFAKKRVAQYDSLHAYLTFMVDGLRRLWPDFNEKIKEVGGVFRPGDFQLNFGGIPLLAAQSSYSTISSNAESHPYRSSALPDTMLIRRPKLEAVLYRLLIGSSGFHVRTIQGNVLGVFPASQQQGSKIRGVSLRTSEGEEQVLDDVALVVDCTGSTQAGLKWLKAAGYIPDQNVNRNVRVSYDHKLRYVTITFDHLGAFVYDLPIPGGFDEVGFIYTYYAHSKWGKEGFVLTRMDGDTIQLCCGGWGDVHLPKEKDDILTYVRSVKGARPPAPWVVKVVEMLVDSEGAVDARITFKHLKIPAPSYVQYHDITELLPSNFVAIGDSEMQLNPIFAQGCSKALLGAMTLNTYLHQYELAMDCELPADVSKILFHRLHEVMEDLWTSTKAIDYGYSTTIPISGERRLTKGALVRWFAYHAARAAEKDEVVASALWHVRMLATPQVELFKPRVILGIIWASVARNCSRLA